jgi:hypothetical protein
MIGNTCQDIGKPGTRIDIVEARGGNQRIHRRRSFAAAITAGEQPALPAESNHPFILPMSGKSWKSIIRGIRFSDIRSLFGG